MHPLRTLLALTSATSIGLAAGIAGAGPNREASVVMHIAPAQPQNACAVPNLTRWNVITGWYDSTSPWLYVYVIVCNASSSAGVGGLEFGINYQGGYDPNGTIAPLNVWSWHNCADSELPTAGWPGPGTGNVIQWSTSNCVRTESEPGLSSSVVAIAGYFYLGVYGASPATMRIGAHSTTGAVRLYDCMGNVDMIAPRPNGEPSHLGEAGFSGLSGYNACFTFVVPTTTNTWGQLKALAR